MTVILCESCGHVMGVSLGRCILCGYKNLTHYGSAESRELQKKIQEITGRRRPVRPMTSAFIAVTVTTLAMYAAQWGIVKYKEFHKANLHVTTTYIAGRQMSVLR